MNSVLSQSTLSRCDLLLLGKHWQIVMLDSQVKGKPYGWLDEKQLALLEEALVLHPKRHTLIAMHHHAIQSGSAWLDQHQLHNQETFWTSVSRHNNVKGIVCGHIHQDLDTFYQGCRVLAAPSTCIQFLPRSEQFALDPLTPGWREIVLHSDGHISSEVGRLSDHTFLPDMSSSGY